MPVVVDTVVLLQEVQEAFLEAERLDDASLLGSSKTVLSALVVVLRYRKAELPDEVAPHILAVIYRKRRQLKLDGAGA